MKETPKNASSLFIGSCFALISTSVAFATVGAVMGPLKEAFLLTNQQVGMIGGIALSGFTLAIIIIGPFVDLFGMKRLMTFSFFCHLVGPLLMIFANDFTMLYVGALIIAIGNGTVEAVCNPLVATLYPDQKTKKLNQFHVWFPGGIAIGGIASYLLDQIGLPAWELKMSLVLIPTVIYGFLFFSKTFPATERVQSGISTVDMLKAVLHPVFFLILLAMAVTASLELGPGRWIPSVLGSVGIPGIVVLAYINGLMAILRYYAGPIIERFSPPGILVASVILGSVGLYWFSFADSTVMAFISATVFAVGVCYIWPTTLGLTNELFPKTGAFGLALVGGMGMLVVGQFTSPQMGKVADEYLHDHLPIESTEKLLTDVVDQYPILMGDEEPFVTEVKGSVETAQSVLERLKETGELPDGDTAIALRSALKNSPEGAEAISGEISSKVLGPAENAGGRVAFRYLIPFAIIPFVIYLGILIFHRRKGGYKAQTLGGEEAAQ